VTINTGAPLDFFRQQLPHQALSLRPLLLDSGAFQVDAFTVDMKSEPAPFQHPASQSLLRSFQKISQQDCNRLTECTGTSTATWQRHATTSVSDQLIVLATSLRKLVPCHVAGYERFSPALSSGPQPMPQAPDAMHAPMHAESLEEYHRVAGVDRAAKVATEAAWLRSQGMDLVVSDVVPLACAAAAAVSIPSVCVSNFSWGELSCVCNFLSFSVICQWGILLWEELLQKAAVF